MAELIKFGASEIPFHIRHDLRQISPGKSYGNESIDSELSGQNYSLVERGKTAAEVNQYRKKIEKEIFQYNRKNLVHAVEWVVQCPNDCPADQRKLFFRETYNYIVSQLPMGERSVYVAEVHRDEHKFVNGSDISKEHLHVMFVPAVRDSKHPGFEYKLCADQLTKRKVLRDFHPGLQRHLDEFGIKATVYTKKDGNGRNISLSVSQLKEISDKTGIVLKKSMTVDELAGILKENEKLLTENKALRERVVELERQQQTVRENEWGTASDAWGKVTSWSDAERIINS